TTLGGIWARTSQGIKAFIAGVARHLWHTAGGAAIAWDSDLTGDTVDDEPDAILSCTISGADAPLVTGTVWILAAIEVGRHTGTADLEIEIGDSTASNFPIQDTARLFQAAGGAGFYERTLFYLVPY